MPLSVTSIYPYFLVTALLLGLGWILARYCGFYRQLLTSESASARFHAIDGLRGMLALGVFFHHAIIRYFLYLNGRWDTPPSHFYTLVGHVGVAVFFMITGFLFWTKGLNAQPYLKVQPMLWSRLCRLVPMYMFSMLVVLAITALLTGFALREPAKVVIHEATAYLSFGFLDTSTLNGIDAYRINASVQWSLKYEWLFYVFLPLGLIFARGRSFVLLAIGAGVLIRAAPLSPVLWNFIFGAIAALVIDRRCGLAAHQWQSGWSSVGALIALGAVFIFFDSAYGLWQAALLFCAFLCIANGNDLFGLLATRAARFLGAISYSVYLMHGIVLFVVFGTANRIIPIGSMPALDVWLLLALSGIAVIGVCTLTYRYIEHPFMRLAMPPRHGDGLPVKKESMPHKGAATAGSAASEGQMIVPVDGSATDPSSIELSGSQRPSAAKLT